MADIGKLVTIEDYQRALETTLNMLEEVLSYDSDMPSANETMANADQWLESCRHALEKARA